MIPSWMSQKYTYYILTFVVGYSDDGFGNLIYLSDKEFETAYNFLYPHRNFIQ